MKHAIILILVFGFFGCKEDAKDPEAPVVTTGDAFTISGRGTVVSGTVSSAGGYTLTEAGVVYGTNSSPSVNDIKVKSTDFEPGEYPEDFSVVLREGFPAGTVYYRAYVLGDTKPFYGETKQKN